MAGSAVQSSRRRLGGTLAEVWNGTNWTIQPTRNPGEEKISELSALACTSAAACIAVGETVPGDEYRTLAESRNGTTWATQTTPNPRGSEDASLTAIACTSASSCTAVGDFASGTNEETLGEVWNGSNWTIQPTPNPT